MIKSFIGGLVSFTLRYNEVDEYQPKMTELEEAGIWEKLCGKKISYFENKDMPGDGVGFVYKVLKKWLFPEFSFTQEIRKAYDKLVRVLLSTSTSQQGRSCTCTHGTHVRTWKRRGSKHRIQYKKFMVMMMKTMTIKKSKIDNYKRWILKKYGLPQLI